MKAELHHFQNPGAPDLKMNRMTQGSIKSGQLETLLKIWKVTLLVPARKLQLFPLRQIHYFSTKIYQIFKNLWKSKNGLWDHVSGTIILYMGCISKQSYTKKLLFFIPCAGLHCYWFKGSHLYQFSNGIWDLTSGKLNWDCSYRHSTRTAIHGYFSDKLNWSDKSVNVIEHYLSLHKQLQSAVLQTQKDRRINHINQWE